MDGGFAAFDAVIDAVELAVALAEGLAEGVTEAEAATLAELLRLGDAVIGLRWLVATTTTGEPAALEFIEDAAGGDDALVGELALDGADGARKIIWTHRAHAIGVPFSEGTVDIDTPADYARLQSSPSESSTLHAA